MNEDTIFEIGIDKEERLYIIPRTKRFPYIYREAMEVHWNDVNGLLYSPKPREWSYFDWFKQIIRAAREQDCILKITEETKWVNIPSELKELMINFKSN